MPDATAFARQAAKLAPKRQDIVLNLAAVYQKARNNPEAIQTLRQALANGMTSTELWFALALSEFNMGAFAEAIAGCDRALALNPHFERALQLKGRSYARMSRPDDAVRAFRAALEANNACDYCRSELAAVLVTLGRNAEAESLLSGVAARFPGNAGVQYEFGKLLAARGENMRAVAALEAAVKADPKHDQAWYVLARLYSQTGERSKAAAAFNTVRRLQEERRSAAERRLTDQATGKDGSPGRESP
jgi:tetratricopeptide (TPR) repeat protein